ncbi:hypothetical protein BOW53_13650 [Solemya pervernicosa gill symbiont]|uniref:Hemerythrin-like domain-containing protein n=2 Tax=Gammaproteobacteria incertae sedis TaxID=118884 RepID=A0A1T2L1H3_9GAMM|nr:hemerythrin domain-containing protein [Solemya pervernicosa gill symbiont]OOZ38945.1 hypothetical protein BOW53_13650 [Solemya pervernicosa gill symbiont]
MHKTLARLYRDHLNSNRLMDILEGQLEVLKFTKPLPAKLMSEIVSYVREYTDKIHHPIEDHLYQVLLARTDRGHDEMEELLGQHLIVVDLTRKMLQAVDSADGGDNDSIDRLIEAGRELISHQRNHMNFEDRMAFPLLQEELKDEDFDIAAGALPDDEDPLLDPNIATRYPELFSYLNKGELMV